MNVQIFGTKKSFDTKKAQRYFKERRIKVQFIDLKEKEMSKGELTSVMQAVGGIDKLLNPKAKDEETLALIQHLTPSQRFDKLLEATVDQVGGDWAPEIGMEGYKLYEKDHGEDEALARVRDSARRIFTVMNQVQLFDNPYSDREYAKEVLSDQAAFDFGQECSNKSIVMLKNKDGVISKDGIKGKPKCYIPQKFVSGGMFGGGTAHFELAVDEDVANELFDVVTDTVGEPTGKAMGGFPGMPVDENASSDPVYQASDAKMPSDEELAQCKYAILVVDCPTGESSLTTNEDGTVTCIGTDHAPHTAEEKEKGAAGMVGLETAFGVCYTKLCKEEGLPLELLVHLMSTRPAEILGLAKGQLEPGFDADFVLVDLDTPYTVEKEKLHSKSHNTPFDGVELYGKVCATIKGGKITYQAQ